MRVSEQINHRDICVDTEGVLGAWLYASQFSRLENGGSINPSLPVQLQH